MAAVVPAEFVTTDEAIQAFISQDAKWSALHEAWLSATDEAKESVYAEVWERQEELSAIIETAVRNEELSPLALRRMGDCWVEHTLPGHFWESGGAALSLWTGFVDGLGLSSDQRWISDAPLCFRRQQFDEWLAVRATVRNSQSPDWWTVPEAAVWIRTRDMICVEGLEVDARSSLTLADETVPGAFDAANVCLQAALKEGRIEAAGVPLRAAPSERADCQARERIPQEFWSQDGGALQLNTRAGRAIVVEAGRPPTFAAEWMSIAVPADDCQLLWPMPASFLSRGTHSLEAALAHVAREPMDYPHFLLTHPDVTVTGLNAQGERVTIDRSVLVQGQLDIGANTISTKNDGLRWWEVTVELTEVPSTPAQPPQVDAAHPIVPREEQADRQPPKPQKPTAAEVDGWYAQRVLSHDPQQLPPSRADDEKDAKDHFQVGGLKNLVRAARKRKAPADWQQPGSKGRKLRARQSGQK